MYSDKILYWVLNSHNSYPSDPDIEWGAFQDSKIIRVLVTTDITEITLWKWNIKFKIRYSLPSECQVRVPKVRFTRNVQNLVKSALRVQLKPKKTTVIINQGLFRAYLQRFRNKSLAITVNTQYYIYIYVSSKKKESVFTASCLLD